MKIYWRKWLILSWGKGGKSFFSKKSLTPVYEKYQIFRLEGEFKLNHILTKCHLKIVAGNNTSIA